MFAPIYEIRIPGKNIKIDEDKWNEIREYARSHKLFYIVYQSRIYRYTHAQTYMDRPTRFDFEIVPAEEEGVIEYIYVKDLETE